MSNLPTSQEREAMAILDAIHRLVNAIDALEYFQPDDIAYKGPALAVQWIKEAKADQILRVGRLRRFVEDLHLDRLA